MLPQWGGVRTRLSLVVSTFRNLTWYLIGRLWRSFANVRLGLRAGLGAEIDDAEGKLMDGFGDGGGKGLGGGTEMGECSLQSEREEEGGDRDNNENGAKNAAAKGEDN